MAKKFRVKRYLSGLVAAPVAPRPQAPTPAATPHAHAQADAHAQTDAGIDYLVRRTAANRKARK